MYDVFIIRSAAVLLSLNSLAATIIALVFAFSQYLNAAREERKNLIPLFGNEYVIYAQQVRHRLLRPAESGILLLFAVANITGIFIR